MRVLLIMVLLLGGCASKRDFLSTQDYGKKLGVITQHCAAYGPFKTTRGKDARIKLGAAVVCEK